MIQEKNTPSFKNCGIRPKLLEVIEKMFPTPTPIQHRLIPIAIEGKDVVGIAQTGTGKTLAFGVPIMQRLALGGGQALILVPTRELAMQVEEMLMLIGKSFNLKIALIIGGAAVGPQLQALRRHPHVIVATPGRLTDLMNQGKCPLKEVKIVVLDEADRMLDIGFMPQIKEILGKAPSERQTMLFSATMPATIAEIANRFMKQPLRIEVSPSGTTAAKVEQIVYFVSKEEKYQLVEKLLAEHPGTVLIFTRTKFAAKKLTRAILQLKHTAVEIHSNRSLGQRKEALAGFKSGKYRVMVATDIAARGIDVKNISLVINYDVPDNLDDYVHRIGRTGRAEAAGKAITLATPSQKSDIRDIERLVRKQIPVASTPKLPPRRAPIAMERDEFPRSGGRQSRSSSGGRFGRGSQNRKPSAYGSRPKKFGDNKPASGKRFSDSSSSSRKRSYGETFSKDSARAPRRSSAKPQAGGRPRFDRNKGPRIFFKKGDL
jgi:ATP-dependent RNA helicase RhlE